MKRKVTIIYPPSRPTTRSQTKNAAKILGSSIQATLQQSGVENEEINRSKKLRVERNQKESPTTSYTLKAEAAAEEILMPSPPIPNTLLGKPDMDKSLKSPTPTSNTFLEKAAAGEILMSPLPISNTLLESGAMEILLTLPPIQSNLLEKADMDKNFMPPSPTSDTIPETAAVEISLGAPSTFSTLEDETATVDKILMPPPPPPPAVENICNDFQHSGNPQMEVESDPKNIPGDLRLHNENCPYRIWAEHRESLSTDEEIRFEFLNHYMGRKSWNNPDAVAEAQRKCDAALAKDGPVMHYLQTQRDMFDSFREINLLECNCDEVTFEGSKMN